MSNVALMIGGREFSVASAPGEEQRVAALGRMIDAKLTEAGAHTASSESRMLLVASLLLADELHDLRNAASAATGTSQDSVSTDALDRIAERLENIAARLEDGPSAA